MIETTPLALSVEKVRHEMLRGILVPRHMVNDALALTYSKLKAKETKFFSHKGQVTAQVDVENHTIQMQAADQIFSLAGLYAREREDRASTPGVALEVDPTTGVVRIIVGSVGAPLALEEDPQTLELPPAMPSPAEAPVVVHAHDTAPSQDSPVRTRRVEVPLSAWKILSDEIVE